MAELTQDMIEARAAEVIGGMFEPYIPSLGGLLFVKMDLRAKGISSRAYSARLIELHKQGGYYPEALLPQVVKRLCAEQGIDYDAVLRKQRTLLKKIQDNVPADLAGPIDKLTDEEAARLSSEEREARDVAIRERGQKIAAYVESQYTPEDWEVRAQADMIEALERDLQAQTYEHHARKAQMEAEILHCCRKVDNPDGPYFADLDDMAGKLEAVGDEAAVLLMVKWRLFKQGRNPDFFSL